jgi:hypothetical protein
MEKEYARLQDPKERTAWIKASKEYRAKLNQMINDRLEADKNKAKKDEEPVEEEIEKSESSGDESKDQEEENKATSGQSEETEIEEDDTPDPTPTFETGDEEVPKKDAPIHSNRYKDISSNHALNKVMISHLYDIMAKNMPERGYYEAGEIVDAYNQAVEEVYNTAKEELEKDENEDVKINLEQSVGLFGLENLLDLLGSQGTRIVFVDQIPADSKRPKDSPGFHNNTEAD